MSLLDKLKNLLVKPVETTTEIKVPSSKANSIIYNLPTLPDINRNRYAMLLKSTQMYYNDPRVQESTNTLARDIAKSGFAVEVDNRKAQKVADTFVAVTEFNTHLHDWIRYTLMWGDSFLERIISPSRTLSGLKLHRSADVSLNTDKQLNLIMPNCFWYNPEQLLAYPTRESIYIPQWQLNHAKWHGDEYNLYGVPLFASAFTPYTRVFDGENDLYIKRRNAAGVRISHSLEGASPAELEDYQAKNKEMIESPFAAVQHFFSNKKTTLDVVTVDPHMEVIADINLHIETLLIASPVPSALVGYGASANGQVLAEQKKQYDLAVSQLTDTWCVNNFVAPNLKVAWLLAGIDPNNLEYKINWRYRIILSPAELLQIADAILRFRAAGASEELISRLIVRYIPGWTVDELTDNIKPVNINSHDPAAQGTTDPNQQRSEKVPTTKVKDDPETTQLTRK